MVQGAVAEAARQGSVVKTFVQIGRQEGVKGYWKGNLPQVLRVLPYSATQLCGYEIFKKLFAEGDASTPLPVQRKLAAGACAGMLSTLVTYPLDSLRLRLAVDPAATSIPVAIRALVREGGARAFYRGLGPALCGIAPYMALELATYDSLPQDIPAFARGFTAALLATSCCYPLDTIRRRIQVHTGSIGVAQVVQDAWTKEGLRGFYRGFLPNALKNLPNKGIRLSVFANAKGMVTSAQAAHTNAVDEWRRRPVSCSKAAPAAAKPCCAAAEDGVSHGSRRAAIVESSVPLARSTRNI
eukprot:jgi/Ulvmu1/10941/UM007_0120.1